MKVWRASLRFLLVLGVAVFLSHSATVWLLYALHFSTIPMEPPLEPLLVAALSFPALYFFALGPVLRETRARRQAESALETSRHRVADALRLNETIVGASSIGVVAYRACGQCILANAAAARIIGATREALLEQNFMRLESWKKSGLLEAALKALASGTETQCELRFTSSFGKTMWGDFRLVPFGAEGELHLLLLIDDISERKHADEQVRLQSAALEASATGMVITDTQGIVLWNNQAFLKMTGYSETEVRGRHTRLLKSGIQDKAFYTNLWQTIRSGQVWRAELVNRRKDGSLYPEEMTITPILTQGCVTHFIAVKQDVSEKKALEKQFLRAQRMESIGTLASGIAHDLNNILTPISMSAELLCSHARDEEDARLFTLIQTNTKRGADVVRQVLTFGRGIEGQRVGLQARYLVKEIEKIILETFPKSIDLRLEVPKNLWTVLGDVTQLHQVLLNLCVNARDAMPEGGTLHIWAENLQLTEPRSALFRKLEPGPYLLLGVSDTGIGIPEEIIEKIFEPFFTTKELGKGTGLGLSTVLGIVRSHNGSIDVESQAGRGSTFRVYLPAQPGEHAVLEGNLGSTAPVGQGQCVLLVEDEPHVRHITQQTLTEYGYDVVVARNGKEALDLFPRHCGKLQAVITDVLMPEMDGLALTRSLRGSHPQLPVIACTGWGQMGVRSQLKNLGVTTILEKPYRSAQLLEALHAHLAGLAVTTA